MAELTSWQFDKKMPQAPLTRFVSACMHEFCAFAQIFSVCFLIYILAYMDALFWAFFVFCSWLFCIINCKMSVAAFLLVSFLHFVSCGHIHIAQLCVDLFACLFAFWIYIYIRMIALFFAVVLHFA